MSELPTPNVYFVCPRLGLGLATRVLVIWGKWKGSFCNVEQVCIQCCSSQADLLFFVHKTYHTNMV